MATVESANEIEKLLAQIEVTIDEEEVQQLECDEAMFATLQSEFDAYMRERKLTLDRWIAFMDDVYPEWKTA